MFLYICKGYFGDIVMVYFKIDNNYNKKANIRRAERQLEQSHKSNQKTKENTQKDQETIKKGGVVLRKDQVLNVTTSSIHGTKVFNVTFKNGVHVEYMDQTSKKLAGVRFNAPGRVSVSDSNINLYNIINGSVFGTPKSENINLDICRCVNVDGNGGNDNYTSYQDVEYSHNSYAVHIGDYYEKKQFTGYANWYMKGKISEEKCAGSIYGFSFRDDGQHREELEALSEIDELIKEVTKHSRAVNSKLDVEEVNPDLSMDKLKEHVKIKAEEGRKDLERYNFIETIQSYQDALNSEKLRGLVKRNNELTEINEKHAIDIGADTEDETNI